MANPCTTSSEMRRRWPGTPAGPRATATMAAARAIHSGSGSRRARSPGTRRILVRAFFMGRTSSPDEQPQEGRGETREEHDLREDSPRGLASVRKGLPGQLPRDVERVHEAEQEAEGLEHGEPRRQDRGPREAGRAEEVPPPPEGVGEDPEDVRPVRQEDR